MIVQKIVLKANITFMKTPKFLIRYRERIKWGLFWWKEANRNSRLFRFDHPFVVFQNKYWKTLNAYSELVILGRLIQMTRGDPNQSVQYIIVPNSRYCKITINVLNYISWYNACWVMNRRRRRRRQKLMLEIVRFFKFSYLLYLKILDQSQ